MQPTTEKMFPLSQRLTLLREIMERRDISQTAKNICWLLLCERMNAETGKCLCSNSHIAKKIGASLASIKRAKLELRKAQVLEEKHPAQNEPTKKSQISSYRFLRRFVAQNEPSSDTKRAELKMSQAQNEPRPNQEPKPQKITIKLDGPQADELRKAGAKIPYSSRHGVWQIDAQQLNGIAPTATSTTQNGDDASEFQQFSAHLKGYDYARSKI